MISVIYLATKEDGGMMARMENEQESNTSKHLHLGTYVYLPFCQKLNEKIDTTHVCTSNMKLQSAAVDFHKDRD